MSKEALSYVSAGIRTVTFGDAARSLVRRSRHCYGVLEPIYAQAAIARWRRAGRPVPAPAPVKRDVLRRTGREHRLRVLIETGTFRGDTAIALRRHFDRIVSVELSPELHASAARRARRVKNVELVQGNSADVLPGIVARLSQPALFWLDAHYAGGVTAMGDKISPILAELDAVLGHQGPRHVVLIDDARNFRDPGRTGYPGADAIGTLASRHGYLLSEKNDIFFLLPDRAVRKR
jgi:hypothetical protein